jgi:hypothetical protein
MNFGTELANFLKNKACRPYEVMHALMNNRRMGGFHLVDIQLTNNGRLGLTQKKNKKITMRRNIAVLGQGAEGVAFIGCIDKECKKMVVIKAARKGLKLEYKIMMRVFKFSPHVVTPYMFVKCEREEMLYQEYANGGDLLDVITKHHSIMSPSHVKTIIFQILVTLATLKKKVPSFTHNDMHLKNILLDLNFKTTGSIKYGTSFVPNIGLRALITDFGFANTSTTPNPKVVSKEHAADFGIAPDSNRMYDAHLFLNALYIEFSKYPDFVEALEFITSAVPAKYLGSETTHVRNSRLIYGGTHSDFPSFLKLLYHPYFREFKKERTNFTNSVNMNSPVNVLKMLQRPPRLPSPPKKPQSPPKAPSPPKKPQSPPKAPVKASDDCGKKAQPVTGIGAQKLTTQEMVDLIKRRGHQVPKGKPSREELCAVIKEHSLVVTPKQKVAPVPAPAPAPVPVEAAKIKQFIASQNIVVEKPAAAAAVAVPFLSEKKLWDLHTKKLTNEIYETIPKEGDYENRMNQARDKAVKLVRNMKARGEAPPPYYKK